MKKGLLILIIFLGLIIIFSLVFVFSNNRPSSLPSPIPTPTVGTGAFVTQNTPVPLPTAGENLTPQELDTLITALEQRSTTEDIPQAPVFNVPAGFQFPTNANLSQRTTLEIIPPSLTPNPQTKRMNDLDRELLYLHLSQNYYFDPARQNVLSNSDYRVKTSIIDFGTFDPPTIELQKGESVIWFNQNKNTCQLRTDPKSPAQTNQIIGSQKTFTQTFQNSGIYLFFCQGYPDSSQSIIVT